MMKHHLKKLSAFSTAWLSDSVLKTLPIFIATNLVALVIWQLNISHLAMPLILGIIAGGLVDLDNSFSGRVKNLISTLSAFSVSAFCVQLALAVSAWLLVPLITLITFCVIMLGAIGQRYSTIAFGTLVVAVYTTLTYTPAAVWYANPLMILAGTTLYSLVAMAVYLAFPNRTVQENLAKFFEALSAYLLAKSAYFDPDDDDLPAKQLALAQANSNVMAAFDQTRVSLFYRLRGRHRHARTQQMLRYYFTAQDILERAGSSHYQYHELFDELKNSDLMFRFQRILELQAAACQRIASALRHGENYRHSLRGEKALQGLSQSLHYHQQQGLKSAYRWYSIADNLRHIEGQLSQITRKNDAADFEQSALRSTRLIAENISGWRNMVGVVKDHFTLQSPLFRHAVRLSIVVFTCSLIPCLFGLESTGYWILLTAIFVCQPNYLATKSRLIQRVIGTILGVVVGYFFQYFSPSLEAQLGMVVLTGSLYTFFRFSNYRFSTFYITLMVLVSLDIIGQGASANILPRMFDTLIGTALAWCAVTYLWADWQYTDLAGNLRKTLKASAVYLRHIVAQLQFGYNEQLPYRAARRTAHNALSALSSTVTAMYSEPQKYAAKLDRAPALLGLTSTLMGYISALGAYRIESRDLNKQVAFSTLFFSEGKQLAALLEQIADQQLDMDTITAKIEQIDQALKQFENTTPNSDKIESHALVLIQQLRLIAQLLSQLAKFKLT